MKRTEINLFIKEFNDFVEFIKKQENPRNWIETLDKEAELIKIMVDDFNERLVNNPLRQ